MSILYAVNNGYLDDVPVDNIREWEHQFHQFMDTVHPEVGRSLMETKDINETLEKDLQEAIQEFRKTFEAKQGE